MHLNEDVWNTPCRLMPATVSAESIKKMRLFAAAFALLAILSVAAADAATTASEEADTDALRKVQVIGNTLDGSQVYKIGE
jgi:hypothetical protein